MVNFSLFWYNVILFFLKLYPFCYPMFVICWEIKGKEMHETYYWKWYSSLNWDLFTQILVFYELLLGLRIWVQSKNVKTSRRRNKNTLFDMSYFWTRKRALKLSFCCLHHFDIEDNLDDEIERLPMTKNTNLCKVIQILRSTQSFFISFDYKSCDKNLFQEIRLNKD